jgi:hypothetical protein
LRPPPDCQASPQTHGRRHERRQRTYVMAIDGGQPLVEDLWRACGHENRLLRFCRSVSFAANSYRGLPAWPSGLFFSCGCQNRPR